MCSALENDVDSMISNYTQDFSTQPFCTIENLMNYYHIKGDKLILKEDIIIIDNRSDIEQKVSMLPGAITKNHFEKDKKYNNIELINKQFHIIIYCTIGYRSARYTDELLKRGYLNVFNSPGIIKWCHFHHKQHQIQLQNNKGIDMAIPFKSHLVCKIWDTFENTSQVHVFASKWDLVPETYNGVVYTNWEFIMYIINALGDTCKQWLGIK